MMDKEGVTGLLLFVSSQWLESLLAAVHSGKCLQTQKCISQQETNCRFKDAEADPERKRKSFYCFYMFCILF